MTTQWWHDEEHLFDVLHTALSTTPAPSPEVVRAAKAVYMWRTIDADIASLAYDSLRDHELAATGMRAESASLRTLTFSTHDTLIELGVSGSSLLGQIAPQSAGVVEVRHGDAVTARVPVNELGCFTITPVPSGSFVLHCQLASGAIITEPITL
jgi:hypothetical protein